MKKSLGLVLIIFLFGLNSFAQNLSLWNGKKCAVVLTYDDGLNVHLDNAISVLDSLGLKGTFYIPANSQPFARRMEEWRIAAQNGHELGNHTLFHPCNGNLPGRDWVSKDHDLANYSLKQIVDEVNLCNTFLNAVDGKTVRTFAYTCGDREVEGKMFYDEVDNQFVAARGVTSLLNQIETIDLKNVNSFMINGENGDELIKMVEDAAKSNAMIVFLFHGVGGEHSLDVSLSAHRELLTYLSKNESLVWTTTMAEAAVHIRVIQKKEIGK